MPNPEEVNPDQVAEDSQKARDSVDLPADAKEPKKPDISEPEVETEASPDVVESMDTMNKTLEKILGVLEEGKVTNPGEATEKLPELEPIPTEEVREKKKEEKEGKESVMVSSIVGKFIKSVE